MTTEEERKELEELKKSVFTLRTNLQSLLVLLQNIVENSNDVWIMLNNKINSEEIEKENLE